MSDDGPRGEGPAGVATGGGGSVVRALQVASLIALLLGAATTRAVVAGEREIAASTVALDAGDAYEATVRARRAAGWYVPGAPHVRVAYERLVALALAAEGHGDRELALFAWRAVRPAARETRWIVVPHEPDLERANAAIARLSAAGPRAPNDRTEPATKIEREQLALLAQVEGPSPAWAIVLVGSFAFACAGALVAARRAIGATGRVSWRRAAPGLALAAAGVAGWLLALWRA